MEAAQRPSNDNGFIHFLLKKQGADARNLRMTVASINIIKRR
jgi:hypothetical protein